jgi:hypothetical protein
MSLKKQEIECIVERIVESIIFEAFDDNFSSEQDVAYALDVFKNKVENLDIEDFDHLIDY